MGCAVSAVKVKAWSLNYSHQRLELMKEYQQTKDQESIENKLKGLKLAQDNDLKEILTPEQQVLLKKGGKKIKKGDKRKKDKKAEDETEGN